MPHPPPEDTSPNPLDGTDNPPPLLAETPAPTAGTPVDTGAVCIDNSPTHEHPSNTNKPTQPVHPPQSILRKPTDALQQQLNNSLSNDTKFSINSLTDGNDKVIHDKSNKLWKEMTGGHLMEFNVKDFIGLLPIWPIVELTLTPSGASKDKRMTQYVQCILALFGKILLVNEKAAIAPIKITNNKPKDMITDKANILTNFTKLGRWLMLSGGSWVFNKANNDVYGRFCLKSTVPVNEMIM
jgi:hypothetical protein